MNHLSPRSSMNHETRESEHGITLVLWRMLANEPSFVELLATKGLTLADIEPMSIQKTNIYRFSTRPKPIGLTAADAAFKVYDDEEDEERTRGESAPPVPRAAQPEGSPADHLEAGASP